jgi:5-deoxy-glucuronate isomerase
MKTFYGSGVIFHIMTGTQPFYLHYSEKNGYTAIPGNSCGFSAIDEFGVLSLDAGQQYTAETAGRELGIMILSGKGTIEIDTISYEIGSRSSVFNGLPQAVYIPPGSIFTITGHPVEAAFCYAKCENNGQLPRILRESDVTVTQAGRDNRSREMRTVIPPKGFSKNLVLGEIVVPPGNWSATPPHKHEADNVPQESFDEELYYFRTDNPAAWGIQRIYSKERDLNEFIFLENNTITLIPYGYHQVVAGPGYPLYYLFFLAGTGNDVCPVLDPDYSWMADR